MEPVQPLPDGATCRVCGTGLGAEFIACPACEVPVHRDCWYYNEGCPTFGCCCATPPEAKSTARRPSGGPAPALDAIEEGQSVEDRLGVHPVGKAHPQAHLTASLVWVPNTPQAVDTRVYSVMGQPALLQILFTMLQQVVTMLGIATTAAAFMAWAFPMAADFAMKLLTDGPAGGVVVAWLVVTLLGLGSMGWINWLFSDAPFPVTPGKLSRRRLSR